MNFADLERVVVAELGLATRPVAVCFMDKPATTEEQYKGTQPAGCSFWRLASQGQSCTTTPEQHSNCAIGCYTHNIPLPEDRKSELDDTLDLMSASNYLNLEEVSTFATLDRQPEAVKYVPLSDADLNFDVAIIVATSSAMMLLQEAAIRSGVPVHQTLLGRPTCTMLPAAIKSGLTLSLACIGNRIYTQSGDSSLYAAIPMGDLFNLAAELPTVTSANAKLGEYHRRRLVASSRA